MITSHAQRAKQQALDWSTTKIVEAFTTNNLQLAVTELDRIKNKPYFQEFLCEIAKGSGNQRAALNWLLSNRVITMSDEIVDSKLDFLGRYNFFKEELEDLVSEEKNLSVPLSPTILEQAANNLREFRRAAEVPPFIPLRMYDAIFVPGTTKEEIVYNNINTIDTFIIWLQVRQVTTEKLLSAVIGVKVLVTLIDQYVGATEHFIYFCQNEAAIKSQAEQTLVAYTQKIDNAKKTNNQHEMSRCLAELKEQGLDQAYLSQLAAGSPEQRTLYVELARANSGKLTNTAFVTKALTDAASLDAFEARQLEVLESETACIPLSVSILQDVSINLKVREQQQASKERAQRNQKTGSYPADATADAVERNYRVIDEFVKSCGEQKEVSLHLTQKFILFYRQKQNALINTQEPGKMDLSP